MKSLGGNVVLTGEKRDSANAEDRAAECDRNSGDGGRRRRRVQKSHTATQLKRIFGTPSLHRQPGQPNCSKFVRDVIGDLQKKGLHKTELSAEEAFVLYNSGHFTRRSYTLIRKFFRNAGVPDPFPSLNVIKEMEGKAVSSDDFRVFTVQRQNKKGEMKDVTVSHIVNIRNYLNKHLSLLAEGGKLLFDGTTKDEIWLGLIGDKGSEEFKLALAIGNISCPNSHVNQIPIAVFNDDESAEAILFHLQDLLKELNDLTSVTIDTKRGSRTIAVRQYLVGDMKFLQDMLGHHGHQCTYGCALCYFKGKPTVGEYVRGQNYGMRTEAGYERDSKKGTPKDRKGVKPNWKFVFKFIRLLRVVPQPSHDHGIRTALWNMDFIDKICGTRVKIENLFGILTTKFRVFRRALNLCPASSQGLILALSVIHNLTVPKREAVQFDYETPILIDPYKTAEDQRTALKKYLKTIEQ
ncbi:unnamed protein product [Caenorhabditis sp. 36 PRJEB53466]|nr:unnamed protein product [Caenorhabditis sp. 36 PRJEB53466]